MQSHFFTLAVIFAAQLCFSQTPTDTTKQEEEDYSMYADVETSDAASGTKVYCSQKIIGLSPTKLISLGFDFVGANTLEVDTLNSFLNNTSNINYNYGTRVAVNFPVISNNKMILNLGANYLDFRYKFAKPVNEIHPLNYSLANFGLVSYGANATLFKPLNSKHFIIIQANLDFNSSGEFDAPTGNEAKVSGAALFGVKPHDRRQYGFGVTRSYRGGGVMYTPVFLYNYTFPNKKWGAEVLLPAKANLRYSVNSRNILLAGFELEGNSYLIKPITDYKLPYNDPQLKRSEIRPRLTYECSLYQFIWLSVQVGYRMNYRFNLDDGDFYRNASSKPYVMENKPSGAYYFNISLNLVSP